MKILQDEQCSNSMNRDCPRASVASSCSQSAQTMLAKSNANVLRDLSEEVAETNLLLFVCASSHRETQNYVVDS
jgi:hypothetical protein